jgi:hypothetical protein
VECLNLFSSTIIAIITSGRSIGHTARMVYMRDLQQIIRSVTPRDAYREAMKEGAVIQVLKDS